jgi:hypothetical protein
MKLEIEQHRIKVGECHVGLVLQSIRGFDAEILEDEHPNEPAEPG